MSLVGRGRVLISAELFSVDSSTRIPIPRHVEVHVPAEYPSIFQSIQCLIYPPIKPPLAPNLLPTFFLYTVDQPTSLIARRHAVLS